MSDKYRMCQARKLTNENGRLEFLKCSLFKRHDGPHTDGRKEWIDDADRRR